LGIDKNTYFKVLERDNFRCVRCNSNQNLTLHHIIHKEFGGTDRQDNLSTLCFSDHRDWHKTFDKQIYPVIKNILKRNKYEALKREYLKWVKGCPSWVKEAFMDNPFPFTIINGNTVLKPKFLRKG
jgi:5-methylcytosine-specific restriction endonuclease McrA